MALIGLVLDIIMETGAARNEEIRRVLVGTARSPGHKTNSIIPNT